MSKTALELFEEKHNELVDFQRSNKEKGACTVGSYWAVKVSHLRVIEGRIKSIPESGVYPDGERHWDIECDETVLKITRLLNCSLEALGNVTFSKREEATRIFSTKFEETYD